MLLAVLGYLVLVGVSVVGVRLLFYFHSFFRHWRRYRALEPVTTAELAGLDVPYARLHWTTRGTEGSTEVIVRGVRAVEALAAEDPVFYRDLLRVEICTESAEQAAVLEREFGGSGLTVEVVTLPGPAAYQTPNGTQKKARSLHYMTELRRSGWGRRPGRTFVVHYDEESVLEPAELRKLLRCLATTDKLVLEGPIYYPLEYTATSVLCRALEAARPIGCFECRTVMERGLPLHLHGSNLVVEEEFENALGWDMGCLDGQPFIAEDYVFGSLAFLEGGREAFGWHGAVMLEQPPFSYRSAFQQRGRWITGVLQGQAMLARHPRFRALPRSLRLRLIWGTRFRILTFALGLPLGALSLAFLPLLLVSAVTTGSGQPWSPLPAPASLWMALVGFLWLASIVVGAWYNTADAALSPGRRYAEIAKVLALAPVSGMLESAAGAWAVLRWLAGHRRVSWQPTPKTRDADLHVNWSAA